MPSSESSLSSTVADFARLGRLLEESRPRLLAMLERRIDPALQKRLGPEDILHEAYLRAHLRWNDFQQNKHLSPYAWLYRLTRDCLYEAWRKHTGGTIDLRKDMPFPERSSVQLGLSLVAQDLTPGEALVRQELQQRMRQVVDLLKDKYREVLWMRHGDGLTHAEAAEILGITENNATVRYLRALQQLRDLWRQLNPDSELRP